jgi:Alginate export
VNRTARLWSLLSACCSVVHAAASTPGEGPSFRLLRADEDYSMLANETTPLQAWKRVKFIPLSEDKSIWASVGGDLRGRYERYENDAWGDGPQDGNGFFSGRTLLHADVHANEHLRLFGQLQTGSIAGRNGGPRPPDRDDADVHQLFVGLSGKTADSSPLDLRIGRQEVQFGSGCLISVREGAGTRRSFEGATLGITHRHFRASAFWLRPVRQLPGTWDNEVEDGRSLAGLFVTTMWEGIANATVSVDAYLLQSRQSDSSFAGVVGHERRLTLGSRGSYASRQWDANAEAAGQFGRQGGQKIRAWFATGEVGWTWRDVPGSPRLGLRAGAASGDASAADGKLGTFNALYPNLSYFGEIALLGPANLLDLHPTIKLALHDDISLTLGAVAYWRHRVADSIYGASLMPERAAGTSRARKVGRQFDAKLVWSPSNDTEATLSYAVFRPAAFLRETGPSRPVQYLNLEIAWRF